jgi:hypothetical protein
MRLLKIAAAAATLFAASTTSPAVAVADTPYCECLLRCSHLYTPGTWSYQLCVTNCETDYGPGICSD